MDAGPGMLYMPAMMKRMKRTTAALALGLVFLLWSPACMAGDGPLFFWEIQGHGNTMYLLGSVHFAEESLYPLDSRITDAFDRADALVVEVDVMQADQLEVISFMGKKGQYPPGETLTENLSQKTLDKLKELKISLLLFNNLRPWYFALILQVREYKSIGLDESLGIDVHFLRQAHEKGMDILQLETVLEQMAAFASVPEEYEDDFLYQSLLELDKTEEFLANLFSMWNQGDVAGMAEFLRERVAEDPRFTDFFEAIIFSRNDRMAAKLADMLQSGKQCFAVVGALHMVGERGIIEQLRGMGFNVRQIGADQG